MNKTRTLEVLDFAPGIRALPINYNFDLIKSWIEQERLRVSGWGIVEGFELKEHLNNFTISVSDGIMINKRGEQLEVEGEIFDGYELDPEYGLRPRVMMFLEQNLKPDETGTVTLQYPIYTEDTNSVLYGATKQPSDLLITNSETGDIISDSQIRSIVGNTIIFIDSSVSVDINYKITVNLKGEYANDRMDGIFIKKDASPYTNGSMLRYEIGYSTDTPTCNEDEYIIGYAYWHVGKVIEVEFITVDRSYRQVYVDEDGQLWLMGRPYEGYKFILFETEEIELEENGNIKKKYNRPNGVSNPVANDLWYDLDENILKIWRIGADGEYGWYPVNDLSRFRRESYIFSSDEMPDDLQTFDFDKMGLQNLRFTPGNHELTIIIDQIVIMEDQYVELKDDDSDTNVSGYGFRLIDKLDRETIVEVRVEHNAYRTDDYYKDVFEKTSCFVYDNHIPIAEGQIAGSCYVTDIEYEPNQRQLEVWLNGTKLLRGTDFYEYRESAGNYQPIGTGEEAKANAFMVSKSLKAGDILYYKISRYMATYANFKSVISDLEKAQDKLWQDFNEVYDNHIDRFETFVMLTNSNIKTNKTAIDNISADYRKASDKIAFSDLNANLKSAVTHKVTVHKELKTTQTISLPGGINDFFYVIWVKDDERIPLIRDLDYFVDTDPEDKTIVNVSLATTWQSSKAKLYIEKRTFDEA